MQGISSLQHSSASRPARPSMPPAWCRPAALLEAAQQGSESSAFGCKPSAVYLFLTIYSCVRSGQEGPGRPHLENASTSCTQHTWVKLGTVHCACDPQPREASSPIQALGNAQLRWPEILMLLTKGCLLGCSTSRLDSRRHPCDGARMLGLEAGGTGSACWASRAAVALPGTT